MELIKYIEAGLKPGFFGMLLFISCAGCCNTVDRRLSDNDKMYLFYEISRRLSQSVVMPDICFSKPIHSVSMVLFTREEIDTTLYEYQLKKNFLNFFTAEQLQKISVFSAGSCQNERGILEFLYQVK
jgi:hypothetical protein